jgi:2'-hydroxyisoflavone reductase
VQYIDVRDLADWIVLGVETGLAGIFNATGKTGTLGELIDTCLDVVAHRSCTLTWASDEQLLAAGLSPWMGIPLWIAAEGWEGAHRVTIEKAVAAGLTFRPLRETVRDTLAWDLGRGGPAHEGLSAAREQEVLASL